MFLGAGVNQNEFTSSLPHGAPGGPGAGAHSPSAAVPLGATPTPGGGEEAGDPSPTSARHAAVPCTVPWVRASAAAQFF